MSIRANVSILSNQNSLIIKSFTRIFISSWMSIRANVSILFNQITLIIKWMSIRANPFRIRYEEKGTNGKHKSVTIIP
jgi:hypothetical protein